MFDSYMIPNQIGWAQQSCSALNGPCGGVAKRQCCAAEGHGLRCDATAIENDSNGRFVAYTGVCQRNCQPLWGMCMPGANSPSQCCTELGLVCRETGNMAYRLGTVLTTISNQRLYNLLMIIN